MLSCCRRNKEITDDFVELVQKMKVYLPTANSSIRPTFLYIHVYNSKGSVDFTDSSITEEYRNAVVSSIEDFMNEVANYYNNIRVLACCDITSKYGFLDFVKEKKDSPNGIDSCATVYIPELLLQLCDGHVFTLPLNEREVFQCEFYTKIPA